MFDRLAEGRWWDRPWSLVEGCTPCSPGCDHCWLRGMDRRFGRGQHGVRFVTDRLGLPLHRKKPTAWAIWSDLCHESVRAGEAIAAFNVMRETPQHVYLLLTKRPKRMLELSSAIEWPANCWAGVTGCNQEEADEKIPVLLQVPAAVRFMSYEPALEMTDLRPFMPRPCSLCNGSMSVPCDGGGRACPRCFSQQGVEPGATLQWVIAGGESGRCARPAAPHWFRSVRDQCLASGVSFFFKGWGEWSPCGPGVIVQRVGKARAGRLLDGRTWDQLPDCVPCASPKPACSTTEVPAS